MSTKGLETGRNNGAEAKKYLVPPKLAGLAVVFAVMVIPNVPAGYLTPGAVFLGALGVYAAEYLQRGRS